MDFPKIPSPLIFLAGLPLDLAPRPGTPFDDAILELAKKDWWPYYRTDDWRRDAFPNPHVAKLPSYARSYGSTPPIIHESQLEWYRWENQALEYFYDIRRGLGRTYDQVTRIVQIRISRWEVKLGTATDLDPELIARRWLDELDNHSVAGIYRLRVSERKVYEYVDELMEKKRFKWELPPWQRRASEHGREQPSIHILGDARATLIDLIQPYVDPTQHNDLSRLVNYGTSPQQPILCACEQVRLGEIFYDAVKSKEKKDRAIQSYKTVLARWLYLHFRLNKSGGAELLSKSTLLNYLSGKGFAKY